MNASSCLICTSPTNLKAYAVVAPWIREILSLNSSETTLQYCDSCDFSFFSKRYSKNQMQKLYDGYRGTKYFRQRTKWEFWYTKQMNAFWTIPSNVSSRQKRIDDALRQAKIDLRSVQSCLDYGGDEGQFIPQTLPRESRFVLDISSTEPAQNFVRISGIDELPRPVELVMCCMVLEHVDDPRSMMSDLVTASSSFVYIEVPNDSIKSSNFHKTLYYKRYLEIISKSKWLFIWIDFLSGLSRNFLGFIPWFGIVKQSEHINYFTNNSLDRLIRISGSNVEVIAWKNGNVGGLRMGQISGILRKEK